MHEGVFYMGELFVNLCVFVSLWQDAFSFCSVEDFFSPQRHEGHEDAQRDFLPEKIFFSPQRHEGTRCTKGLFIAENSFCFIGSVRTGHHLSLRVRQLNFLPFSFFRF